MSSKPIVSRPRNFDKIFGAAKELLEVVQHYLRNEKDDTEGRVWMAQYEEKWNERFQQVAKLMLDNDTVARVLSLDDLRDRFRNLWRFPKKPLSEFSEDDLRAHLDSFFGEPETYHFFFPSKLSGLQDGYEIGLCKVHAFDHLPEDLRDHLLEEWDYKFEREKSVYGSKTKEEYVASKKQETYFCTDVEALGNSKATEIAMRAANQSLNIIKTLYIIDLRKLSKGYWTKGKGYGRYELESPLDLFGWRRMPTIPELEKYAATMTGMIRRGDNSEIASKCLSAVDIYGLIERETPIEIRFLLSVIALEAILLGKEDQDLLGMKLREKVAILLGDTPFWVRIYLGKKENPTEKECEDNRVPARVDLARKVSVMYGKRSRFAHADKQAEKVTEEDFRFASMVFRFSLQRVLSLYEKNGIRRITKEATLDKESLDHFIESLKYSVPLGSI